MTFYLENTELKIDDNLVREYSDMVAEPVGSEQLSKSLTWLAKMATKAATVAEAVSLYGKNYVSQKIEEAMRRELETFNDREL